MTLPVAWVRAVVVSAILLHVALAIAVVGGALPPIPEDFPSFYYAARVWVAGGDPWDPAALAAIAGHEQRVWPFLYPPPFLLTVGWMAFVPLPIARGLWAVASEAALLASLAALWRWRGRAAIGPLLLTALCWWPVWANLRAGQANLIVLALALAGLLAAHRGREVTGGALVGAAAALKLLPLVWVVFWALRGQLRASGVALAVFAGAMLLASAIGPSEGFFTQAAPALATGDYGLGMPLDWMGNHSGAALGLGVAMPLLGAAALVWLGRASRGRDALPAAAGAGVCALLAPAWLFDHHLVLAMPAAVVALTGLRGPPLAAAAVAWVALALPMRLVHEVPGLRLAALLVVLGACAWLTRSEGPAQAAP